jgi:hypothetical protein
MAVLRVAVMTPQNDRQPELNWLYRLLVNSWVLRAQIG